MKKFFRSLVVIYLRQLAHAYIRNHNVQVVFVSGDAFKSHIKDMLVHTLNTTQIPARANYRGYNFDIGIPLSILRLQAGFTNPLKWIQLLVTAQKRAREADGTKVLVFDIEIKRHGDADTILHLLKPDVLILDSLAAQSELQAEYQALIDGTKGRVIINADQTPATLEIPRQKLKTYSTAADADAMAVDISETDEHQIFTIQKGSFKQELKMNIFGVQHIQAFLATNLVLEYLYN